MRHYSSKPWCRATRVLAKGDEKNKSENVEEEFGDYEENNTLYENFKGEEFGDSEENDTLYENFKEKEFGDYRESDALYENSRKDVAQ